MTNYMLPCRLITFFYLVLIFVIFVIIIANASRIHCYWIRRALTAKNELLDFMSFFVQSWSYLSSFNCFCQWDSNSCLYLYPVFREHAHSTWWFLVRFELSHNLKPLCEQGVDSRRLQNKKNVHYNIWTVMLCSTTSRAPHTYKLVPFDAYEQTTSYALFL